MRFVVILAGVLLPSPALASQASDPVAPPAAEKPAEKKICRAMPQTGSIMTKRECHTRGEWAEIARRSTAAREKLDRDYGGRTGGIGVSSARQ
ncbi:hypothetical protein FHS95_003655 [Sphingomonas naasensis]|uniref:hypothetical protein n=1 Tax=Sphingomonas naasensis TaxID=1344951 RepID=UPI0019CF79CA|nr:hypothetical protein [Sphingomonas naasensis]NIJ21944.1 hypothetical protein [Sphingomonas naasensis]